MSNKQWGTPAWNFLHALTFEYPDDPSYQTIQNMSAYITAFSDILPCDKCKQHFKQLLIKFPPRLDSQVHFFQWAVDIHNQVNKKLGKKIWTYQDVLNKRSNKNLKIFFILILIILIFLYFKK
jgi:hypothetical protein